VRSNGSKQSGRGEGTGRSKAVNGSNSSGEWFPCAVEARDTVQARVERSLLAEEQVKEISSESDSGGQGGELVNC
jgi:hypothetical protein